MIPSLVYCLLSLSPLVVRAALEVDLTSRDSIKKAAAQVAEDLLAYYHGEEPGHIPGVLPGPPDSGTGPYYWWEAGAMWGALLDYWHWTGDDTYNDVTYRSLLHQAGPNRDFVHNNWSTSLGNDDQAFWGMSALIAAETKFVDPPPEEPQWLALAQAVWNEQTADNLRDGNCSFGLRWQTNALHNGFKYKNTIANACFFNIGARLARYTKNETYMDWTVRTWDWLEGVKYIADEYRVYDGGFVDDNCTSVNRQQFSYNAAVLLQGAAFLYDYTKDDIWLDRVNNLIKGIKRDFFIDGVAYEPTCEAGTCTADMLTYKGFTARWLGYTALLVPSTANEIMELLMSSTKAAVAQCTGGANGRQCGFHWTSGKYDGHLGVGEQMNVLGSLSALLAMEAKIPVTNDTGGTSLGDPDAGVQDRPVDLTLPPVTTGDKAGAGILTVAVVVIAAGSLWWMLV